MNKIATPQNWEQRMQEQQAEELQRMLKEIYKNGRKPTKIYISPVYKPEELKRLNARIEEEKMERKMKRLAKLNKK